MSRLSSVGPQGPQGPATGARPPVEGIKPLPQRPSFQQRYQQDAFEDSPRRQGKGGGGGGGGLNLSGGEQGGGAQAREGQDPEALRQAVDARKQPRRPLAPVTDFQKGQPPRERPAPKTQQPQKAQPRMVEQPAPEKPKQKQKKPLVRPPQKPALAAAFKPVLVGGEVKVERRTDAERKVESPQVGTMMDDVAAAQMSGQLTQRM